MLWFWTPFFARKKETAREDLPLQARVSTLDSEMLGMRADLDKVLTTVKRLQGKVYRGVQLGETAEAVTEAPGAAEVAPDLFEKADLYRRAAQLRGR